MNGADRADLPKSPPDFRILRGKTNEFMRIYEATEPSDLLAEAFARLLPQLSERMTAPDREAVARIVASPATRQLVAAAEDGRIVGLLSVALYDVPSGRKAWIEDVVVDAATRGRGIGEALVREALDRCRAERFRYAALIPGSEELRRWYAGFGFAGDYPACFRTHDDFDFGTGDPAHDRAMVLPLTGEPFAGETLDLSDLPQES